MWCSSRKGLFFPVARLFDSVSFVLGQRVHSTVLMNEQKPCVIDPSSRWSLELRITFFASFESGKEGGEERRKGWCWLFCAELNFFY